MSTLLKKRNMLPPFRNLTLNSLLSKPHILSLILFPRHLQTSTSSSPIPTFTHTTVLHTISTYANDWSRALDFFNWVEQTHNFHHTNATYNATIDVLGKYFEFDLGWDLVRRMEAPDHTTFRIIFKRYAAAHLVKEAVDAFNRSEEFKLKDVTLFYNLVDALCEHRHVVEAADICLGKDPPFPADTKIYNMLLRGWFKMRWWRMCWEFWEKMDKNGVEKDLHSYSVYMHTLVKSGKPWKAVKVYKQIKKEGFVLDVVAYNIVVQAVGLENGVDDAIRLFKEMMELGCQPNVVTFNTIIKMLCYWGRFAEAYSFLDKMMKMGSVPNVITYHCFFQNLNRPKEILWLFERMISSGCKPSMDTYVMLLKKFGRWGFLRPVFIVWKVMEEEGCSPDAFAYNALIDALIHKGMIDMARKYDEEMLAKGLSAKPRKELGTKIMVTDAEGAGW